MDAAEREAVKGMLLEAWIDDLREDRRPRIVPEIDMLTQEEISEVMALARWYKGALYPTRLDEHTRAAVLSSTRSRIAHERARQRQAAEQVVEAAGAFDALLHTSRQIQDIDQQVLERSLTLPAGIVKQLEAGNLPPHRVPVDKLAALLRRLGLRSTRVVALARQASVAWAHQSYGMPQTQLGRIDPSLSDEGRHRLFAGAAASDEGEALKAELARIEAYCKALAMRLA